VRARVLSSSSRLGGETSLAAGVTTGSFGATEISFTGSTAGCTAGICGGFDGRLSVAVDKGTFPALGVGALGGVLAAGLTQRLGPAAQEAGRLLAGVAGRQAPPISPLVFRHAIERSLLPVFAALLAVSAVNLLIASKFPRGAASAEPRPKPAEGLA